MLRLEFCGEWFDVDQGEPFHVGREGPLGIDDNPYLHRRFLRIVYRDDLWWVENVGTRLAATLADAAGSTQAWLAPGARLPLVHAHTAVLFSAGPTTYEINIVNPEPAFAPVRSESAHVGDTTIGPVSLTE
ncbi:MAG TPA: hypothetical protein VK024_07655, partial [Actinomycetaceae bacterium]|nr:hypothetical protein [Actinomycetaceae bacterium]